MNWWKELKGKVRLKEPLIDRATFKIGGRADFFILPYDITDLKLLLILAKKQKLPVLVIGAGSNILIKNGRLKAIVVKLNSGPFKEISFKGNRLKVGSGVLLSKLVKICSERGLSGGEFLTGIPGTVGGAVIMNAGTKDRSIGGLVEKIKVADYNGRIKNLTGKAAGFRYRNSNLEKYIVLSVVLKFVKKDKKEIKDIIKKYLEYRRCTQGLSSYSAGCVFKNPAGESAGSLIDLCGLKGRRIGGAYISERHANFILNSGKAKTQDVLALMDLVKKKVRQKFGIILEPEIKIWQ